MPRVDGEHAEGNQHDAEHDCRQVDPKEHLSHLGCNETMSEDRQNDRPLKRQILRCATWQRQVPEQWAATVIGCQQELASIEQ